MLCSVWRICLSMCTGMPWLREPLEACATGKFRCAWISSAHERAPPARNVRMLGYIREREKHYISSSHLGLIRCLTPAGVSVILHAITFFDESGNPIQICLPHKLSHCFMVKQPRVPVSDVLQALTFIHCYMSRRRDMS